ncbi:protein RarD [Paraphotobacterium marinum]|uniref:Protein RarD n=1 Tax=Paraphotobacterium marinum TaxID=1755811 RepID=A0A220VH97_9GAMM|nr:EamA family transporter RarD [Paraphotobacterium marinum]ASK79745.1 protein RarD [Paraphotobacterium marinum]
MQTTESNKGFIYAFLAFFFWGIAPLYFALIHKMDIFLLLAIRITFSVPLLYLVVKIFNKSKVNFKEIFTSKTVIYCFLASIIYCVSWTLFALASNQKNILAVSLAYFINPIICIFIGTIIFKERLPNSYKIAMFLVIVGIFYQISIYHTFPLVSILMAVFFALYGMMKKFIKLDSITSIFLEALLLVPLALVYLVYYFHFHKQDSLIGSNDLILYIGTSFVTILPLILFTLAVQHINLNVVGIMQYVEPTIQFFLATLLLNETFNMTNAITFSFIWIGIFIIIVNEAFIKKIKSKKTLNKNTILKKH